MSGCVCTSSETFLKKATVHSCSFHDLHPALLSIANNLKFILNSKNYCGKYAKVKVLCHYLFIDIEKHSGAHKWKIR